MRRTDTKRWGAPMKDLEGWADTFPAVELAVHEALSVVGVSLVYVAAHTVLGWLNVTFKLPRGVLFIEQVLLGLSLALVVGLSLHRTCATLLEHLRGR